MGLNSNKNVYLSWYECQFNGGVFLYIIFERTNMYVTKFQFWAFLRHIDNLSKTSKISELIISESRDQCPRGSRIFIYTFLALTIEPKKIFRKSVIFLIIWGVPPTSRQPICNLLHIMHGKLWPTWLVSNRLRNFRMCPRNTFLELERFHEQVSIKK